MRSERARRHRKILEIVGSRPIRTQEELKAALAGLGWSVTQSSVSRDIASLKLVKVDGAYRPAATPVGLRSEENPDERHIGEGVTGADSSGDALLVLHTPPGEANRVAVSLDRLAWPEVAGTIAGDDTIFVATRSDRGREAVLRRLRQLVPSLR